MAITFHPDGKVTGNDLIVAGYGAFRAARDGNQTLNHNTHTTVIFNNEIFDIKGWYDHTTGKYTPQVAGYYYVYAHCYGYNYNGLGIEFSTRLYKNEDLAGYTYAGFNTNYGGAMSNNASDVIQVNGTTDYIRVGAYQYTSDSSDDNIYAGNAGATIFNGHLVQAT
jgi:hypothetical protein